MSNILGFSDFLINDKLSVGKGPVDFYFLNSLTYLNYLWLKLVSALSKKGLKDRTFKWIGTAIWQFKKFMWFQPFVIWKFDMFDFMWNSPLIVRLLSYKSWIFLKDKKLIKKKVKKKKVKKLTFKFLSRYRFVKIYSFTFFNLVRIFFFFKFCYFKSCGIFSDFVNKFFTFTVLFKNLFTLISFSKFFFFIRLKLLNYVFFFLLDFFIIKWFFKINWFCFKNFKFFGFNFVSWLVKMWSKIVIKLNTSYFILKNKPVKIRYLNLGVSDSAYLGCRHYYSPKMQIFGLERPDWHLKFMSNNSVDSGFKFVCRNFINNFFFSDFFFNYNKIFSFKPKINLPNYGVIYYVLFKKRKYIKKNEVPKSPDFFFFSDYSLLELKSFLTYTSQSCFYKFKNLYNEHFNNYAKFNEKLVDGFFNFKFKFFLKSKQPNSFQNLNFFSFKKHSVFKVRIVKKRLNNWVYGRKVPVKRKANQRILRFFSFKPFRYFYLRKRIRIWGLIPDKGFKNQISKKFWIKKKNKAGGFKIAQFFFNKKGRDFLKYQKSPQNLNLDDGPSFSFPNKELYIFKWYLDVNLIGMISDVVDLFRISQDSIINKKSTHTDSILLKLKPLKFRDRLPEFKSWFFVLKKLIFILRQSVGKGVIDQVVLNLVSLIRKESSIIYDFVQYEKSVLKSPLHRLAHYRW